MIVSDMRVYEYFTYGEPNEYGQPVLSKEPVGAVKMSIYNVTQHVADTIQYRGASYVGFTFAGVTDKMVIQYGDEKLKVLYTVKVPRMMTQVIMEKM